MQVAIRNRHERLLSIMQVDTVISVRELSERLGVSMLTIRRDLDNLQERGLIDRIHGGAKLSKPQGRELDMSEVPFFLRQNINIREKRAIAHEAVRHVKSDQVILLDSSTTGLYFVKAIPESVPLTIITHSAYIPVELVARPNLQVISTGGILHSESLCYLGDVAENTLRQFNAHRAVFGTRGITVEEGCTDIHLFEVRLKSVMAQCAEELWILADHSKLNKNALASFASISQVHTLVTDEKADQKILDEIEGRGVNVIVAGYAL